MAAAREEVYGPGGLDWPSGTRAFMRRALGRATNCTSLIDVFDDKCPVIPPIDLLVEFHLHEFLGAVLQTVEAQPSEKKFCVARKRVQLPS